MKKILLLYIYLAAKNFIFTIVIMVLYTLPAYVLLSSTQVFMVGIFVFIVCGFGLIAYVSSFMFLKAFTPYLDEVTKNYTDDDPASWMHSDDQTSESDEDNPESTKVTKKLIVDNSYHVRQYFLPYIVNTAKAYVRQIAHPPFA